MAGLYESSFMHNWALLPGHNGGGLYLNSTTAKFAAVTGGTFYSNWKQVGKMANVTV
jgi:hypothetical protein